MAESSDRSGDADAPQPDAMTISDLGAALEHYELSANLSPAEFDAYFATEVELESRLIALAKERIAELEFGAARDLLEEVVSLNQAMRKFAQRQLERTDAVNTGYRQRLSEASSAATSMMLLMQGQIYQNFADEHILSGQIPGARDYLEQARDCYQELARSPGQERVLGEVAYASMVTRIEFIEGTAAMQRGRYESAKEFFEAAFSKYGLMNDQLADGATQVEARIVSIVHEFQREFGEQAAYTHIMIKYMDFFTQMQSGESEDAVTCVTDVVTLYEAWLNKAIAAELPDRVQQVRRMELEYFRGWQAWARAEYSLEVREWNECSSHIRNAKDHWFKSSDLARRHALLGVMTPQYQTTNAEMLLRGTLRRRATEKRLYEQINRLQEENRQLRAMNITHYTGGSVTHENSNISVGGSITGPVAAGGSTAQAGDISTTSGAGASITRNQATTANTAQTNTTKLADLRALAEQLADLREAMAAGAASDSERASVRQIELAEQEARIGNETGTLAHLKAAGRWALSIAEKLAMATVETAIRTSLGS